MISVVMCVFLEDKLVLNQAIESILNQTFRDFEFIIVNDNPDNTLNKQILKDYSLRDKRIKVIENIENIGLTKSLNLALKLAKGKYIARMDADDISLKYRFQKQVEFLDENLNISVCGSAVSFIGKRSFFSKKIKTYPSSHKCIVTEILFSNPIAHPSVMLRKKDLVDNYLWYNEDLQKAQDYDLWFRAIHYITFHNMKAPLLKYRISANQISATGKKEQDKVANIIRSNAILKIIKTSKEELCLHNRVCNGEKPESLSELNKLDTWFVKLYNQLLSNNLYDEKYLIEVLNSYIQNAYIKYYIGIKSFKYFNSKIFKYSRNKSHHLFLFMFKYIKSYIFLKAINIRCLGLIYFVCLITSDINNL